jgi:hypothetical protein
MEKELKKAARLHLLPAAPIKHIEDRKNWFP